MSGVEQRVNAFADQIHEERGPDPRLRVTVVYTTQEGTLSALRAAAGLAKSLAERIALIAIEVVPRQLPIDQPPVPVTFLEESLRVLVSESRIDVDEVSIAICLGRDLLQCLRQALPPRSLVLIGGRKGRRSPEQKLEQWLSQHGHLVVFVDVNHAEAPRQ